MQVSSGIKGSKDGGGCGVDVREKTFPPTKRRLSYGRIAFAVAAAPTIPSAQSWGRANVEEKRRRVRRKKRQTRRSLHTGGE